MKFDFEKDPFENFLKSFHHAELKSQSNGIPDYNAMTLGTVMHEKPSSRTVLFKGLIRGGFSFYTHYDGRKGLQIASNPNVTSTFYWPYLGHQINIIGEAHRLTSHESDVYFQSRPRISQIGAWASDQSAVLKSRDEFENQILSFENKFQDQIVPRPPDWGGFHILPTEIEFWYAHEGRLHERYIYQREGIYREWIRFMRYP